MGRARLNGPPPNVADDACVICLMAVKQQQWEAFKTDIEDAWAADADKLKYIAWLPALDKQIQRGDYLAVCGDFPQLGMIRICWDHVAGAYASKPLAADLDTTTKLPEGLIRRPK
jgi:hypothetical protein